MASGVPSLSYLVCSTPRSGSTLLCETLRATGVLGQPLEHFEDLRRTGVPIQPREFFAALDPTPPWVHQLAPLEPGTPDERPAERWWQDVIAAGLGDNGVWGGKLMLAHVPDLVARARELPHCATCGLDTIMERLLGDARIIFMTREDKVAQAVSMWKALQTQTWRAGTAAKRDVEPVYSADAIEYISDELERRDNRWRRWFYERGKPHHTVTYTDLTTDFERAIAGAAAYLGHPDAAIPAPPVERQGDGTSQEWIDRFHRERPVFAA